MLFVNDIIAGFEGYREPHFEGYTMERLLQSRRSNSFLSCVATQRFQELIIKHCPFIFEENEAEEEDPFTLFKQRYDLLVYLIKEHGDYFQRPVEHLLAPAPLFYVLFQRKYLLESSNPIYLWLRNNPDDYAWIRRVALKAFVLFEKVTLLKQLCEEPVDRAELEEALALSAQNKNYELKNFLMEKLSVYFRSEPKEVQNLEGDKSTSKKGLIFSTWAPVEKTPSSVSSIQIFEVGDKRKSDPADLTAQILKHRVSQR